ncbi:uncharacterized protein ASCRUDRAFT_74472 [Ascoidea rubescens DSM 1968]|uniref:Uncharacterized protein n=1 Tax=Ascoidea rubescens DSM 1968 TaxID=1344418 RepID=A0A1D2VN89_9ASCO|nr:hypothetical protein ASCRUDRAFT_74472 [Ascoidea rubescens DSM 1968]ODV63073.1 hypothetical protein ASCRUDRAFT_74472 [Ascoidea rubescens DSM 1968]
MSFNSNDKKTNSISTKDLNKSEKKPSQNHPTKSKNDQKHSFLDDAYDTYMNDTNLQ